MADRRIAALTTLERVAGQALKQEATILSTLRAEIARHEAERADIARRLQTEAHIGLLESAAYLGDFIRAMRKRDDLLQKLIAKLEQQAAVQQEKVLAEYAEERRAQKSREGIETERDRMLEQKAQSASEEQALIRWMRGRG